MPGDELPDRVAAQALPAGASGEERLTEASPLRRRPTSIRRVTTSRTWSAGDVCLVIGRAKADCGQHCRPVTLSFSLSQSAVPASIWKMPGSVLEFECGCWEPGSFKSHRRP